MSPLVDLFMRNFPSSPLEYSPLERVLTMDELLTARSLAELEQLIAQSEEIAPNMLSAEKISSAILGHEIQRISSYLDIMIQEEPDLLFEEVGEKHGLFSAIPKSGGLRTFVCNLYNKARREALDQALKDHTIEKSNVPSIQDLFRKAQSLDELQLFLESSSETFQANGVEWNAKELAREVQRLIDFLASHYQDATAERRKEFLEIPSSDAKYNTKFTVIPSEFGLRDIVKKMFDRKRVELLTQFSMEEHDEQVTRKKIDRSPKLKELEEIAQEHLKTRLDRIEHLLELRNQFTEAVDQAYERYKSKNFLQRAFSELPLSKDELLHLSELRYRFEHELAAVRAVEEQFEQEYDITEVTEFVNFSVIEDGLVDPFRDPEFSRKLHELHIFSTTQQNFASQTSKESEPTDLRNESAQELGDMSPERALRIEIGERRLKERGASLSKKLAGGFMTIVEGYRALSPKKKLALSVLLIAGGGTALATGYAGAAIAFKSALVAKRVIGSAAMATGIKVGLDARAEKIKAGEKDRRWFDAIFTDHRKATAISAFILSSLPLLGKLSSAITEHGQIAAAASAQLLQEMPDTSSGAEIPVIEPESITMPSTTVPVELNTLAKLEVETPTVTTHEIPQVSIAPSAPVAIDNGSLEGPLPVKDAVGTPIYEDPTHLIGLPTAEPEHIASHAKKVTERVAAHVAAHTTEDGSQEATVNDALGVRGNSAWGLLQSNNVSERAIANFNETHGGIIEQTVHDGDKVQWEYDADKDEILSYKVVSHEQVIAEAGNDTATEATPKGYTFTDTILGRRDSIEHSSLGLLQQHAKELGIKPRQKARILEAMIQKYGWLRDQVSHDQDKLTMTVTPDKQIVIKYVAANGSKVLETKPESLATLVNAKQTVMNK